MPRRNELGLDISTDDDDYSTLPDDATTVVDTCPECAADLELGEPHDTDCSKVRSLDDDDEEDDTDVDVDM